MTIGIISDTHDHIDAIPKAFGLFDQHACQHIIHAGDWTSIELMIDLCNRAARSNMHLYGVLGNRDQRDAMLAVYGQLGLPLQLSSEALELTINNCRMFVSHGHRPVLLNRARLSRRFDVLISGHTHKPLMENTEGILHINPGSTAFAIPRRPGFVPTVATYDTSAQLATIHQLGAG
jgi:putative phosphoesterase